MGSNGTTALSSLLQRTTLIDHEQVLRAANESLKGARDDVSAQNVKAIALLNLDRYDDALRVFEEAGSILKKEAPLAWCYTLYKCGKMDEAVEAAREVGVERGSKHVEAQAAYRSESFQRAAELYEELSARDIATNSEDSDLRINGGATDAQLAWAGNTWSMRKQKVDREDLEQFETSFNAACSCMAKGDLKQAEVLLNRAKDLCNAAEELSVDEKKVELLSIKVQQLYVLSRLGKSAELKRLCDELDVQDVSDAMERNIAQANLFASSSTALNPFLTQRLLLSRSTADSRNPPFKFQSLVLGRNTLATELSAGKTTSVVNTTSTIINSAPPANVSIAVTSAGIYNAAANAHNQVGKSALKKIMSLLEKRPGDIGLLLTIVQMYLFTNNTSTALSLLESSLTKMEASSLSADLDARFSPGLVAVLVALYRKTNRTSQIKAELAQAAHYWGAKLEDPRSASQLFKEAGTAFLATPSADELKEAQELFQVAHSQDVTDRLAVAGLVASAIDPTVLAKGLQEKLPNLQKLTAGTDVSALEFAGIARPFRITSDTRPKKRSTQDGDGRERKSIRARKNKQPKSFDSSKPPDPERWLPLRDRSNWKPKGRKKGKAGMSTQGGVVGDDSRPATPSSQVLQASKSAGASKAKKNKAKGAR